MYTLTRPVVTDGRCPLATSYRSWLAVAHRPNESAPRSAAARQNGEVYKLTPVDKVHIEGVTPAAVLDKLRASGFTEHECDAAQVQKATAKEAELATADAKKREVGPCNSRVRRGRVQSTAFAAGCIWGVSRGEAIAAPSRGRPPLQAIAAKLKLREKEKLKGLLQGDKKSKAEQGTIFTKHMKVADDPLPHSIAVSVSISLSPSLFGRTCTHMHTHKRTDRRHHCAPHLPTTPRRSAKSGARDRVCEDGSAKPRAA